MKWFKHDSDANTDAKLKKLRHKYGIQAYGLYWYCLELIAGRVDRNNITFELEEDAETIAMEWNLDQIKVQDMMQYMCDIGLFSSNSGVISCLKLAKRLDDTNAKNPEIKLILSRLNPNHSESVGDTPSDSEKLLTDETRLDKNIKESGAHPPEPKKKFIKPTVEQIREYCESRNNSVDPQRFFDYNESRGWVVSRSPMKCWKASVRTWEQNSFGNGSNCASPVAGVDPWI